MKIAKFFRSLMPKWNQAWWRFTWLWLFSGQASREIYGRSLSKNSIRTAIFALSVGMSSLSLTLAVFTGFQRLLSDRVISHYGHFRIDIDWQNFDRIEKFFQENPVSGLLRHENFWGAQAIASGSLAGRGLFIEVQHSSNTPAPTKKSKSIAIKMSRTLAQYLGVKLGDSLRLLIPGLLKKALPAELIGFDEVGVYEWDSRRLIVDDASLRQYMQEEFPNIYKRRLGDAHSVRLFLDKKIYNSEDYEKLKILEVSLEDKAQKFFQNPFLRVRNWYDQKHNLLSGVAFDKQILTIVMALLTLIAALNVATSLLVLYFERDRQMALVRAMGLSPSQMRSWLSLQGFFIGLCSSGLGLILSWVLSLFLPRLPWLQLPEEIYNISSLPLAFDPLEQGAIFVFGCLASTLVAYVLSLVLSKMPMVAVLGHRR
jgi:lipoprotein-releasing system permease protein